MYQTRVILHLKMKHIGALDGAPFKIITAHDGAENSALFGALQCSKIG